MVNNGMYLTVNYMVSKKGFTRDAYYLPNTSINNEHIFKLNKNMAIHFFGFCLSI